MPDNIYDNIILLAKDIKEGHVENVASHCDYIISNAEEAKKRDERVLKCLLEIKDNIRG